MFWTLAVLREIDVYITSPALTSILDTEYIMAFIKSFTPAITCPSNFTLEVGNGSVRLVGEASNKFEVTCEYGERRDDLRNFSALVNDRPES